MPWRRTRFQSALPPVRPSHVLTDLPALPALERLVGGEAIQQARAAGGDEVRLAAAAAGVARVPRAVVAALLVGVSQLHGAAAVRVARVVAAGVVHAVGVGAPVRHRAGEDVVRVRHVADAVDDRLLLGQRDLLAERDAHARLIERVAVQLRHALGHALAARVVPGTVADAVARVDRARALRAHIRVPRDRRTAAGGRAELLAVSIGAGDAAVVGAVTFAHARDEERHRLRRRGRTAALPTAGGRLREPDIRAQDQ